MNFGERVLAAQKQFGPVVFGIDPHTQLLTEWGLDDSVSGLAKFTEIAVDAFAGHVGFVKPQSAFFERFGSAGIAILEAAISKLRSANTFVILDAKRGDIGSTMTAYAQAYLDRSSPMFCDAVTLSPFLGMGSLEPAFQMARQNDAGVFVLAQTSNPEGVDVQGAQRDGVSVSQAILRTLAQMNADTQPLGSFGAVVGATIIPGGTDYSINGPILVPGVGAQGGTAQSVRNIFGKSMLGILPAVSRAVLTAGPDVKKLRAAAEKEQLNWN